VHALSATGLQHQGGATPTMGMDGSPHGGTPVRRTMLDPLVVVAINQDFVGTDKSNDLDHFAK